MNLQRAIDLGYILTVDKTDDGYRASMVKETFIIVRVSQKSPRDAMTMVADAAELIGWL